MVVLPNLFNRHHPREPLDFVVGVKATHYLLNVLVSQDVLVLALLVVQFSIDEEHLSFSLSTLVLVDDNQ